MTRCRAPHSEIAELLFLDGNATFADIDLDAAGLPPFWMELIA